MIALGVSTRNVTPNIKSCVFLNVTKFQRCRVGVLFYLGKKTHREDNLIITIESLLSTTEVKIYFLID